MYQIQNGKPKLIAYGSKRLPEAACSYSITELEMCGLAINIASFAHLLRKVDFDVVVDHLAITQIMRSKVKLATNTLKRLLEVLSAYSFNLYYIKGKDMILSDFLSRQDITGGSRLSRIFWEHENQSGLLVIRLIYIKLYRKKETKFWEKIQAKWESGLTAVRLKRDPPVVMKTQEK